MTESAPLPDRLNNKTNHPPRQPQTSAIQKSTTPAENQNQKLMEKNAPLARKKTQTQPVASNPTAKVEQKARQVWKPGRGVVEKVDKATGEIVHLCTE